MLLKRFLVFGISSGIFMLAMLGTSLFSGCEEAEDIRGLTIEPDFVDLTGTTSASSNNLSQTFTVSEDSLQTLSLPLEWSVSNPGLGSIASSGGSSASYVRFTAHGDNSIQVVDQYGSRGVATVRQ